MSQSCRPCSPDPGHLRGQRGCRRGSRRPRCWAKVTGRSSPALATRRWSSKAAWMRSGWMRGSIFGVLLVWGRFYVAETIIPEAQEDFLTPSAPRHTHLFGGLGVNNKGKNIVTQLPSWFDKALSAKHGLWNATPEERVAYYRHACYSFEIQIRHSSISMVRRAREN